MYEIKLISDKNLKSIIPLVTLLNPGTEETVLLSRMEEMIKNDYQCLGVYDNEKLIGICGLWTLTKFYVGKHLEPDNVVIDPDYRNKGIGELMMKWVENYAREQDCDAIELNAYVENVKGVEFWKNLGYTVRGHHFQKLLK
jgi:ribosomal protein S18 acetylase RimI-like enzyme